LILRSLYTELGGVPLVRIEDSIAESAQLATVAKALYILGLFKVIKRIHLTKAQ